MRVQCPRMTSPSEPLTPRRYPKFITAGTTFKVDRQFASYLNTDFGYKLLLAGAAVARINATNDPDGITYHIVLLPANTTPLNTTALPAPYAYVERLTDTVTGEVYDVGSGRIMVNPDLGAVSAGAMVSFEEQTLLVIEAKLQNRLTADLEHYSIAGRSVSKIPAAELLKLRGQFRALVWKQRNPGKLMSPVAFAFPTPSTGQYPFPYENRWTP